MNKVKKDSNNDEMQEIRPEKIPAQGKGLTQREILIHVVLALVSAAGMTVWARPPTPFILVRVALAAYVMALAATLGVAYVGSRTMLSVHAILCYWFYVWAKWALFDHFVPPFEDQFWPTVGTVTWGIVGVHFVSRFLLPQAHE